MNKYIIFGIVTIAIGTFLMAVAAQHLAWLTFGGVINGLGLFIMTAGTVNSTKKDKTEVIDKILEFREEISALKKSVPEGDSLTAVERIEGEFRDWADAFISNKESKIVERQKHEVLLKEQELNLSRQWKHLYTCFFDTLSKMLSAYNIKADDKMSSRFRSCLIIFLGRRLNLSGAL